MDTWTFDCCLNKRQKQLEGSAFLSAHENGFNPFMQAGLRKTSSLTKLPKKFGRYLKRTEQTRSLLPQEDCRKQVIREASCSDTSVVTRFRIMLAAGSGMLLLKAVPY